MPLFGTLPRAKPPGTVFLPDGDHVPDTVPEIGAFFYDGAPSRPNRRGKTRPHLGEDIPKRRHILPVEGLVALGIHVLRSGGSLGIDIEHQKAVVAVARRDPFHRFQRIVQVPRRRGGGVDPDTDQGILSPGPQQVPVLRVVIGNIQPLLPVKIPLGRDQGLLKGQNLQFLGLASGNMHLTSPFVSVFFRMFFVSYHKGPAVSRVCVSAPSCICSGGKL